MLDTQTICAIMRSEPASSHARRFVLTTPVASQSHNLFVGQGHSTAQRLAELAGSQRSALAVEWLWRLKRKGTCKMYLIEIENGEASFALQPQELALLHEAIHVALGHIIEPERAQDFLYLDTLGAAFGAAQLACRLQFELPSVPHPHLDPPPVWEGRSPSPRGRGQGEGKTKGTML